MKATSKHYETATRSVTIAQQSGLFQADSLAHAAIVPVLNDIERQIRLLPIDYLTSRWIDRASVLAIVRGESA